MSFAGDVLIVGGGPAGAAAAIWAASHHLQVTLLESHVFPRHRPGETLHPGLETIFKQLNVESEVTAASAIRHDGVYVDWGGRKGPSAFGANNEEWRGYQIQREQMDRILLDRARDLGVEIIQPARATKPISLNGRVVGVQLNASSLHADFVLDAGGSAGWLRRHLNLETTLASPPLRAYYGYREGHMTPRGINPVLAGDRDGWTWTAQIGEDRFHWTRLAFAPARAASEPPPEFAHLRPLGRPKGADVTWRHIPRSAGPGYFLTGDAAVVLDPAAAHGVMRALMTGMMASHAIARIKSGTVSEQQTLLTYQRWVAAWFHHDVQRLETLYNELNPAWRGRFNATAGPPAPNEVRH